MKKGRVIQFWFVLFLCGWGLFSDAQTSPPKPTRIPLKDSLLRILLGVKQDTIRVKILNRLSWECRNSKPDTSVLLVDEAMSLAQSISKSANPVVSRAGLAAIAKCVMLQGVYFEMQGNYKSAMEADLRAIDLLNALGDKEGEESASGNAGVVYWHQGEFSLAIAQYQQALAMAKKRNDKVSIARWMMNMGSVYVDMGEFVKALDYYLQTLKMNQESGFKEGAAMSLGNTGLAYFDLGDFSKAIEYYYKALAANEEIHNKVGYALVLGNIGLVYERMGQGDKALVKYKEALKIDEVLGNKKEIARILSNMGSVLYEQKKYTESLNYYFRSLKISEEMNSRYQLPYMYRGIGEVYLSQGDSILEKAAPGPASSKKYDLARVYFGKALSIAREIGDKSSIANSLGELGVLDFKMSKYREAEDFLQHALALSEEIGELDKVRVNHEVLSRLYEKVGKPDKALDHFKKAALLSDSLYALEKNKEITRKELNYEFDKKTATANDEQARKDLVFAEGNRRRLLVMYSGAAVLLLLVFLALFIFRANMRKQKIKVQLEEKNVLIEKQKSIVEEQNKHIHDSIRYAKRIQDAILPDHLFLPTEASEYFVLFEPKDIVSGDFYWRYDCGDELFFAVVDCTGHGVPGAMMSMMGYDALESVLKDKGIKEPAQILEEINTDFIHKLFSTNPGGARDGMDLTLCRLNKKTGQLCFAGANNDLWICSETELTVYPVDKQSIGDREGLRFNQHEITLQERDTVYLFTDGFADQKGGAENKKYMRSRFKQTLRTLSALPCIEQQKSLAAEFANWKKGTWQRDDVLVLGFRWEKQVGICV